MVQVHRGGPAGSVPHYSFMQLRTTLSHYNLFTIIRTICVQTVRARAHYHFKLFLKRARFYAGGGPEWESAGHGECSTEWKCTRARGRNSANCTLQPRAPDHCVRDSQTHYNRTNVQWIRGRVFQCVPCRVRAAGRARVVRRKHDEFRPRLISNSAILWYCCVRAGFSAAERADLSIYVLRSRWMPLKFVTITTNNYCIIMPTKGRK